MCYTVCCSFSNVMPLILHCDNLPTAQLAPLNVQKDDVFDLAVAVRQ